MPVETFLMIPLPGGGYWIIGTPHPDEIEGTLYDDILEGKGADDNIAGDILARRAEFPAVAQAENGVELEKLGNDSIFGGFGDDMLSGDIAPAIVQDEEDGGTDELPLQTALLLAYEYGHDLIDGGHGDDMIVGDLLDIPPPVYDGPAPQASFVDGEFLGKFGNDTIFGGSGADKAIGDALIPMMNVMPPPMMDDDDGPIGDDVELSAEESLTEDGHGHHNPFGNDWIYGQGGPDQLSGDDGKVLWALEDTLDPPDNPQPLASGLQGGNGVPPGAVFIQYFEDFDRPIVWEGYRPGGNDHIFGGFGNDFQTGDGGNDFLNGGLGNDYLLGGPGKDKLLGDIGNDVLDGGLGPDKLLGGVGFDTFILKQGEIEKQEYGDVPDDPALTMGVAGGFFFNPFHGFDGDKILDYSRYADRIVLVPQTIVDEQEDADAPQEIDGDMGVPVFVEALGFGYFEVFFGAPIWQDNALEAVQDVELEGEVFYVRGAHKVSQLNIEVLGGYLVDDYADMMF